MRAVRENFSGAVLGDVNIDVYGKFPALPEKGQGINTDNLDMSLGGTAMNLSRLLAVLGLKPYPVASLGRGALGDMAAQEIEAFSLPAIGLRRKEGRTGLMYCVITPDGDRTMLGYRGVNKKSLNYRRIIEQLPLGNPLSFLFISAYLFLSREQRQRLTRCLDYLDAQKNRGEKPKKAVVMSHLFARQAGEKGEKRGTEFEPLKRADMLFMNKDEFELLAGGLSRRNLRKFAQNFALESLLVTAGEEGCWLFSKNDEYNGENSREDNREEEGDIVDRIAGFPRRAVDTTGAGDCFAAGFMGFILAGAEPEKAALFGNFCGAVATTDYGLSGPLENLRDLLGFYELSPEKTDRLRLEKALEKLAQQK